MSASTALLERNGRQAGDPTPALSREKIPWNFVTKNLVGHELLRKKLREKITKLQRHLKHFPPDAVHLNIVLERQVRRHFHTARLTLRLPSNILHARKSAPEVITAFDLAVKALLRELQSLKTDLRGEVLWKRKERRREFRRLVKAAGFTTEPQTAGEGPQSQSDVVADFLRRHYRDLVRHARRQVNHMELSGEIAAEMVDPREVIDEVVRQTITGWRQKPAKSDWLVWFYQLIRDEIPRHIRLSHRRADRSLDEVARVPQDAPLAEGYDAGQPIDIIQRELEPFVAELRDTVPDTAALPPDEAVVQKEILELLQARIQSWPQPERDVFELHFVEGFEVGDVVMITKRPPAEVRELIEQLHQRLRGFLLEEAVT